MTTEVDVQAYPMGAGDAYVSADEGAAWASLGATMENNVFRVRQTKWRPTLNGPKGPVKGLERIIEEVGELEVTIPELSAARMALIVPASVATLSPITETAAGFSTTLAADAAIGAVEVEVASAVGITVGDYLRIGAVGPTAEYRQVAAIAAETLTLDRALVQAHASAATVTQTDGDGRTTITGSPSVIIPDSSYRWYKLVVPAAAGDFEFVIKDAINTSDTAEMAFGRETTGAPRLTLAARYAPDATNVPPWSMVTP